MFGVMNLVTIINIQRRILAKGERGSIQQNLETERFKLKLWMRKLKKKIPHTPEIFNNRSCPLNFQ